MGEINENKSGIEKEKYSFERECLRKGKRKKRRTNFIEGVGKREEGEVDKRAHL